MYTQRELEEKFGFHKQTELSTRQHHAVRAAYLTFAKFINDILPEGEEKHLAFRDLERASMWSHKAIAQTAPLAPLPSEYKPLSVDESLIDLLSNKIDPDPVFIDLRSDEVDTADDGFVEKAIKKLVEDNPQFTRPHVSVAEAFNVRGDYRIILSQGPRMQDMPIRVDGPIEVNGGNS